MAARNVRALTLKKNAAELEEKLSDIKRLVGAIQGWFWEMMPGGDSIKRSAKISDGLEISVRCYTPGSTWISVHYYSKHFAQDRDYDLKTVRILHDNLDVFIELAESVCDAAGVLKSFHAKLARFGV